MVIRIPENRDEAIAMLVEQDVARWGEFERKASLRIHNRQYKTYGLALNAVAARAQVKGEPYQELRRAANAALTEDDWAYLRRG